MNPNRKFSAVIWPTLIILLIFTSVYLPSITVGAAYSSHIYSAKWSNPDPYFIDVDESGNVYVAGRNTNQVQKYDSNGNLLATWGGPGSGNGQFNDPEGIAVDSERRLVYVTDSNNNRIQRFDLNGKFLGIAGSFGSGPGQFINPAGIAVDSYGNIYIADRENNRIQKFYPNGTFIRSWGRGGTGPNEFNSPESVAADRLGYVYVGDEENNRVQKFSSNGDFIAVLGTFGSGPGQFIDPEDVAVDRIGNVYVADSDNSRIEVFNSTGKFVGEFGSQGAGDGQFNDPRGVAVDLSGNVYVADTGNVRIQKFIPPQGNLLITITGDGGPLSGARVNSTSLPAGQAQLNALSASNGTVLFNNLRPGSYNILATKAGYLPNNSTVKVFAGATTKATINLEHTTQASALTIIVKSSNGTRIPGALVRSILNPVKGELEGTTDSNGMILFNDPLIGRYQFKATKTGYADATSNEVPVTAGSTVTVEVAMDVYKSSTVLDHFEFERIPNPQAKNVPFRVKITAVDSRGILVESYNGVNSLKLFDDNTELLDPLSPRSITFSSGIWEGSVTLGQLGFTINLKTFSSSGTESGTSSIFDVLEFLPGTLDHFNIKEVGEPFLTEGPIGDQNVGTFFKISITAVDFRGTKIYSYSGTNTISATPAPIEPTSVTIKDGVGQVDVRISTAADSVTITTNGGGKTGSSNSFKVRALTPGGSIPRDTCIIATATFGSELSPEVQFLRSFRDNQVLSTYTGQQFIVLFNAIYYSFSPQVASFIAGSEAFRESTKDALYPIIDTLQLGKWVSSLFAFNPDLGIVVFCLVVSVVLSLIYMLPLTLLIASPFMLFRKISVSSQKIRNLSIVWGGSIAIMIVSTAARLNLLTMLSGGTFVVATAFLVTLIGFRLISRYIIYR